MAAVSFTGLGVTYPDGSPGLSDVDLEVGEGEFLALIGPSGSGKTTLLRTLAGFIPPTAGEVRLAGELVASPDHSVPVERRGLGMVFQQHAVWPHMTVEQNIAYPLRLAGVPRAERRARVAETLELVGLGGFGGRSPALLSGGQRQRVALGRAIVGRPRVLLLDEALSALDEPLRAELRTQLQAMSKALGLTVVHVTHDRSEALAIADRIAVLDGGRLQQIGTPEELLERPSSAFVARFLADAALFPGVMATQGFTAESPAVRVPRHDVEWGAGGPGSSADPGPRTTGAADPATVRSEPAVTSGVLAVRPEQLLVRPSSADGDAWPAGPEAGAGIRSATGEASTGDPTADGASSTGGHAADDAEARKTSPGGTAADGTMVTTALVRSSLFGRHGCSAQLEWAGMLVTCDTGVWRPEPGTRVEVRITGGLFYAGEASPTTGAAAA